MRGSSIRQAQLCDLDAILSMEQAWSVSERAKPEQFEARLKRFSEGVFLAFVDAQLVGVCFSCLTRYSPARPELLKDWDRVTNLGYIRAPEHVPDANALYIVSTGIVPAYRGQGLREELLAAQISLCQRLGLGYVIAATTLSGYNSYCEQHGELPVSSYVQLTLAGTPIDPMLRTLEPLGLELPGPDHIIENYAPSAESRNHGALLVYQNPAEEALSA